MAIYTPLSTDFKDDILASSNPKRKYQMIYNDDGTVSFQDVTAYSQTGSVFGAKEVNEERAAINKINSDRIVTLDEVNLVTERGFFVDALAVKELIGKTIKYEIVPIVSGLSVGANTMLRQGVISETDLNKYLSKNKATKYIGFCTLDGGYGDQMQVTFTMYEKNLYCQVDNRFASNLTIYPSVCMLMV